MQIFLGQLELLDYVFYATVERGKVYESGAFIHNYALTYALGLVRSETYTYASIRQEPRYAEQLSPLNERIYLTPAAPKRISHRLVQWNTLSENYAFPGKPPSIGYPDWGFARMLRPGCVFTFYLLVNDPENPPPAAALLDILAGRTTRVRLGKFPAKARLYLRQSNQVEMKKGPFKTETYLNWRDINNDPSVCNVLPGALPTRLLYDAYFPDGEYYEARFDQEMIQLPVGMRFLARIPGKKESRRRAI